MKKQRVFSLLSAILIFIDIVRSILANIINSYTISALGIINWVILIAFCAVLILQKNNIIAVIISGANILLSLVYSVKYFSIYNIFELLASISVLIIVLFVSIEPLKKNAKLSKMLWFLPATLLFVSYIRSYISALHNFFHLLIPIVSLTAYIIAWLFFGLWIREVAISILPHEEKADLEIEHSTFDIPTSIEQQKTIVVGNADKIMMYKELLDAGTITQEEFEVKKKQLLDI